MQVFKNLTLTYSVIKQFIFLTILVLSYLPIMAQSGTIEITNIEYDCNIDNEKGMKIHSHINVNGWEGKSVNYAVFFYQDYDGIGGKLLAPNNLSKYKASDGQVCAYSDSKSDYENCEWKDWWVFIPYNALPHNTGQNRYSLFAEIRKGKEYNTTQIAATPYNNFYINYDQAGDGLSGSIAIKNIEYDCLVDNEKGMKIHSQINVSGWKDKPVNYSVFFYKGSNGAGGKLYSSGKYVATDGQVCTSGYSNATYDDCEWKDWWLFIPYSALPHSAGKNDYSLYAEFRKTGDYNWEVFAKTSYLNFSVTFNNDNNDLYSNNQSSNNSTNSRPDHKSNSNNNKYWFNSCLGSSLDVNGKSIESSLEFVYPQKDNVFEIEIVYHNNDTHPASVYLNEVDDNSNIVHSELLVDLFSRVQSSVEYTSNALNLFSTKYHVAFAADGSCIIVYSLKDGYYANGSCKLFKADDIASSVYKVRYEVLYKYLKKYFK